MREVRIRVATVAVVIFVGRALSGCGAPTPARRSLAGGDGSGGTVEADSGIATGGSTLGTGGSAAGTGGRGGEPGGTGGGGSATGGAPANLPDASVGSTGGAVGTGGAVVSGGNGGAGTGGAATGGSGPPDAGSAGPEAGHAVPGSGGTAACFTDPNVIAICKQLEPACMNCPDESIWNDCFDVAAAGDDRACARYAVANDCTVDVGGNTCGSLNCRATGCDRTACTNAQGEGDNTMCQGLLATCPCK